MSELIKEYEPLYAFNIASQPKDTNKRKCSNTKHNIRVGRESLSNYDTS